MEMTPNELQVKTLEILKDMLLGDIKKQEEDNYELLNEDLSIEKKEFLVKFEEDGLLLGITTQIQIDVMKEIVEKIISLRDVIEKNAPNILRKKN
jgi:hypothetical protein